MHMPPPSKTSGRPGDGVALSDPGRDHAQDDREPGAVAGQSRALDFQAACGYNGGAVSTLRCGTIQEQTTGEAIARGKGQRNGRRDSGAYMPFRRYDGQMESTE